MSNNLTSETNPQQADVYEFRVKGHLDDRWAEWFGGMRLTFEANGEMRLSGAVMDQAALHGLLKKVRDLGMTLISVNRIEPDESEIR